MATFDPYHPLLVQLLEEAPGPGEGHRWFFRMALHLRHYHNDDQVFKFLRACADKWGNRVVPDGEIHKAVAKAFSSTREETRQIITWTWPKPDFTAIAKVVETTPPLPLSQESLVNSVQAIHLLYNPGDFICCGMNNNDGGVGEFTRLVTMHPERFQFIVPSPMTSPFGANQSGRKSFRCLDNTGPRRYLVVEGDCGTKQEQAAILAKLATVSKALPLLMVVDSGGKSLHGWFLSKGIPENVSRAWFGLAIKLGCDAHTWTRCQWVRMPGGERLEKDNTTKLQKVVWLNPKLGREPHQP